MGSYVVVVISPGVDNPLRLIKVSKIMLFEEAIYEPVIESFNKSVLSWFPRLNKVQFDSLARCPDLSPTGKPTPLRVNHDIKPPVSRISMAVDSLRNCVAAPGYSGVASR